ncbi:MAG: hypothetical protein QXH73_02605 [Ignisphaera sp.]
MQLKKETRILLINEVEGCIVATVLRGRARIENIIPIESCDKLIEFLESRKGIAAEINYVLDNNVCRSVSQKSISLSEIKDRELIEAVKEVEEIIKKAKARMIQIRLLMTKT